MPLAGFEPAIPAGERLQTRALDRSATGIGSYGILQNQNSTSKWVNYVRKLQFSVKLHWAVILKKQQFLS